MRINSALSVYGIWSLKFPVYHHRQGLKSQFAGVDTQNQQQRCKQIKRLVNNKLPANYSSQDSIIRAESPHGAGKGTLSSQGRFLHISLNMMTQFANVDGHTFNTQRWKLLSSIFKAAGLGVPFSPLEAAVLLTFLHSAVWIHAHKYFTLVMVSSDGKMSLLNVIEEVSINGSCVIRA